MKYDFSEFGEIKTDKSPSRKPKQKYDYSEFGEISPGVDTDIAQPEYSSVGEYLKSQIIENVPIVGRGAKLLTDIESAGLNRPILDVDPSNPVVQTLATVPRVGRAAAVGISESPMFNPFAESVDNYRSAKDVIDALSPSWKPRTAKQSIAGTAGEIAAIAGVGLIPGVGPELATAMGSASNIERTGGLSALDVGSLGIAAGGVGLKAVSGLTNKALPRLGSKKYGVPQKATSMAIEDPEVLDIVDNRVKYLKSAGIKDPGKTLIGFVQEKTQSMIDAYKKARAIVHGKVKKAYKSIGIKDPAGEWIRDLPEYKPVFQKKSYVTGETGVPETGIVPGTAGKAAKARHYYSEVVDTEIAQETGKTLNQLKREFHDALNGDLFKKDLGAGSFQPMSNTEKLVTLTRLKRAIDAWADYLPTGQQVGKPDQAINVALKRMSRILDSKRGKIPGGDALSLADDAYKELSAISNTLYKSLKDPGEAYKLLNQAMRGDIDWHTFMSIVNKQEALNLVENITGRDILNPAMRELASAYLANPNAMALPKVQGGVISSIASSFIPFRQLIKMARWAGLARKKVTPISAIAASGLGLRREER